MAMPEGYKDWSVDRLRFEYQVRQRTLQTIETRIARLGSELEDLYQDYEARRASNPSEYFGSAMPPGQSIEREIGNFRSQAAATEAELGEIQAVLASKS